MLPNKINSLIMSGGKGSRIGYKEKAMIKINNVYLIDIIYDALKEISNNIYVSVSKYVPKTIKHCIKKKYKIIYTTGENYIRDLNICIKIIGTPLLVVASDIFNLKNERDTLFNFLQESFSTNYDVYTLVTKHGLVGLSLFKKPCGKYKNVFIDSSLIDIDTEKDLKYLRKCGYQIETPDD